MFYVQASQPRCVDAQDSESTLTAAIERAYPLETEDAYLNWHGVRIALSYKYDISVIVEDVIEMLESLNAPTGELAIAWPSNTFRTDWVLRWSRAQLHCAATWECVAGGVETLLNQARPLEMPVRDFVAEWGELARQVERDLRAVGYDETLPGLNRLAALAGVERGYLYRPRANP